MGGLSFNKFRMGGLSGGGRAGDKPAVQADAVGCAEIDLRKIQANIRRGAGNGPVGKENQLPMQQVDQPHNRHRQQQDEQRPDRPTRRPPGQGFNPEAIIG